MNENLRVTGLMPDLIKKKMQIRMPFQCLGRNTYTIGGKGKTLRQMHVEYATMTGVLKAEMGVVYPFQWYGSESQHALQPFLLRRTPGSPRSCGSFGNRYPLAFVCSP